MTDSCCTTPAGVPCAAGCPESRASTTGTETASSGPPQPAAHATSPSAGSKPADGSEASPAGAASPAPLVGSPAPSSISQTVGRVFLPGEAFRPLIQECIKAWLHFRPQEAARFEADVRRRRQWVRDNRAKIFRGNIVPEFHIPKTLYDMIGAGMRPVANVGAPVDWLEEPAVRKIFFQEFELAKMTKNPGGPNGAR